MGTVYRCAECGADLNLSAAHLYAPDAYFEAGNKGTLSFYRVDDAKFRFVKEDKIRPFFETVNYWGIQRRRTRILCDACGRLLGHIYDDGPPAMTGHGQFGFGPSQAIPRAPRRRQASGEAKSHRCHLPSSLLFTGRGSPAPERDYWREPSTRGPTPLTSSSTVTSSRRRSPPTTRRTSSPLVAASPAPGGRRCPCTAISSGPRGSSFGRTPAASRGGTCCGPTPAASSRRRASRATRRSSPACSSAGATPSRRR